MNWIEVADTAVKIGLGALISGIVGYWHSRQAHEFSLQKDESKVRQAALEKVSHTIEASYGPLLKLGVSLASLQQNPSNLELRGNLEREVRQYFRDTSEGLAGIEPSCGVLLLLGCPSGAASLQAYQKEVFRLLGEGSRLLQNDDGVKSMMGMLLICSERRIETYGWLNSFLKGDKKPSLPEGYFFQARNK